MLKLLKLETVDLKGVKVNGQTFDFSFDVAPLPTSVMMALRKAKGEDNMIDILTPATVGKLIRGWRSDAFADDQTGEPLPCTPENVAIVIEDCFPMFAVFTTAIFAAYNQGQRKNSLPSSDSTSTAEPDSAEGAS